LSYSHSPNRYIFDTGNFWSKKLIIH
jgi:hypothetical protein